MLSEFLNAILNFLFPKFCVSCGKLHRYLCARCYEQIDFFALPIEPKIAPCYLDQLLAACTYKGPTAQLIKTLKYQSVQGIALMLAKMIWETTAFPATDIITAVPIHPKRHQERGFNQAKLIAQKLAMLSKTSYLDLLIKKRHTRQQASMRNKDNRLTQQADSFCINPKLSPLVLQQIIYQQKSILIIDDVTTTGATLNECARVLTQAGVRKVCGLAVAHEK